MYRLYPTRAVSFALYISLSLSPDCAIICGLLQGKRDHGRKSGERQEKQGKPGEWQTHGGHFSVVAKCVRSSLSFCLFRFYGFVRLQRRFL